MPVPINFLEMIQLPPAAGGAGYPYRISAGDLMSNFDYLDKIPSHAVAGDILYCISAGTLEEWAVLSAPSGSGLHVLTHDGKYPFWTPTEEC